MFGDFFKQLIGKYNAELAFYLALCFLPRQREMEHCLMYGLYFFDLQET